MTHTFTRAAACGLALATLVAGAASAAADFSGFWQLKTDLATVPAAKLKPAAAKEIARIKAGSGYDVVDGGIEYAKTWCTQYGIGGQMVVSGPIDIRQSPIETVVLSPERAEPRHIYTDGQKHPLSDDFDPTSVGHSIGKWDKDILVADTMGISGRGIRILPGGGLISEKTKLVERYELTGPDTLKITSTWTDPTTLQAPFTYSLEYGRVKERFWVTDPPCSPIRAMRAKGIKLPPDAPES